MIYMKSRRKNREAPTNKLIDAYEKDSPKDIESFILSCATGYLCGKHFSITNSKSLSITTVAHYSSIVLFLFAFFFSIRTVYLKLRTDWMKLVNFLGLNESSDCTKNYTASNSDESKSATNDVHRSTLDIASSDKSTCGAERFEDAFTRVLTTLQSTNVNQIFLRRDDVASLVSKLVESGVCTSSNRLQRRLTIMDFDPANIKCRTSMFIDQQNTSRRWSFLSDECESINTENNEEDLEIDIETDLMSSSTNDNPYRTISGNVHSSKKEWRSVSENSLMEKLFSSFRRSSTSGLELEKDVNLSERREGEAHPNSE